MKTIDIKNFINIANMEIEKEVQQRYPHNLVISINSLMTLDSFNKLLYAAHCIGLNIFNTPQGEILNGSLIKFKVPQDSEFYFINDKNKEVKLAGIEFAKIVKDEIMYIINNFCIRHLKKNLTQNELDIQFKFIEYDKLITESSFYNSIDGFDLYKIHRKSTDYLNTLSPKEKTVIFNNMDKLGQLQRYGISISAEGLNLAEYCNKVNDGQDLELTISVPERSVFTINNRDGEMAGDNAYTYALEVLSDVGIINNKRGRKINTICKIRFGETWTKENYEDANRMVDVVNNSFK